MTRDELRLAKAPYSGKDAVSTTTLRPCYATLLRCRRPVTLLINETAQLPLLILLAPAKTQLERSPSTVTKLLRHTG